MGDVTVHIPHIPTALGDWSPTFVVVHSIPGSVVLKFLQQFLVVPEYYPSRQPNYESGLQDFRFLRHINLLNDASFFLLDLRLDPSNTSSLQYHRALVRLDIFQDVELAACLLILHII